MLRQVRKPRGGHDLHRHLELAHLLLPGLGRPVRRFLHRRPQLGARLGADLRRLHVRDEAGADPRPVGVHDGASARQVGHGLLARGEERERRREKEEGDALRAVEAHDPRQDRERRVVHHAAAVGVPLPLVVAAWEERAHDAGALDAVLGLAPPHDLLIDGLWRVAVVRCRLGLELLHKLAVFLLGHRLLHPSLSKRRSGAACAAPLPRRVP